MSSHHQGDPHSVEVLVQLHIQVGYPVQVGRPPLLVPGTAVHRSRGQVGWEGLLGGANVGDEALHWGGKNTGDVPVGETKIDFYLLLIGRRYGEQWANHQEEQWTAIRRSSCRVKLMEILCL